MLAAIYSRFLIATHRIMGLPFLTVLAPSRLFYDGKPRSPKTLLDCARQAALQIHGWLPGRWIVIAAATSADHLFGARPAGRGFRHGRWPAMLHCRLRHSDPFSACGAASYRTAASRKQSESRSMVACPVIRHENLTPIGADPQLGRAKFQRRFTGQFQSKSQSGLKRPIRASFKRRSRLRRCRSCSSQASSVATQSAAITCGQCANRRADATSQRGRAGCRDHSSATSLSRS